MIAHIRQTDGTEQSLSAHSKNVAALAAESLRAVKLEQLGYLAGLIHDLGKANASFERYLRAIHEASDPHDPSIRKAAPHAPVGAIWVYERYARTDDPARRRAAQLLAMVVLGHHSGLCDCLDQSSELRSPFLRAMDWDKEEIHYTEAVDNSLAEVAAAEEIDERFSQASDELSAFRERMPKSVLSFCMAMTARLVLGAVTDADRWDTACFERGADPMEEIPEPKWRIWLENLDARMARFKSTERLSSIRAQISRACWEAGKINGPGIYRLTVPTGGGKTLGGTGFGLMQAVYGREHTERIYYIAPFNTILDQNAKVIREALAEEELLLVHHGDIVFDDFQSEEAQTHKTLTERWTSRVILTSMVQFLGTLFGGKNTNARRLPRLANAILIFDEIQALPRKCVVLFECAARFLASCMGCTVLLCTATQPTLRQSKTDMRMTAEDMEKLPPLGTELIPGVEALFDQLRRVRFIDERSVRRTNDQAAADVAAMLRGKQSILMVVNTKNVAKEVYKKLGAAGLPKDIIRVHLTTDLCAAHREKAINHMIKALDARKENPDAPCVCCISTALIEAGVDISFPVVIRSMAGLPNILQAAGRCNRNREMECGEVYIWRLIEENLTSLPEIRQAQQDSDGILDRAAAEGMCVDRPEMIEAYFHRMLHNDRNRPPEFFYPIDAPSGTLYLASLLGTNAKLRNGLENRMFNPLEWLSLCCNWRTVGEAFKPIEQDTVAVVTPYEDGARIIDQLCSRCSLQQERTLLKQAQPYCVTLYRSAFEKLRKLRAVYPLAETGAWALMPEYYDAETGVQYQEQPLSYKGI